ncbi:hypothetical protein BDA99DRAFT_519753 [Phascolomyces articulosus]|uniref:Zn(2)-C6 fungal-type domain-containing protein n=1 Tax=Phascolomyces articulosus TaxID=60185 RepID=A0AAD5JTN3_9FUNG|nr:hypothetical protein BDA99DRAFT_519753 [Phascolomyces articulosus]
MRNKPCKRCQTRRKKCVWPQQQQQQLGNTDDSTYFSPCIRCSKSNVKCIPFDPSVQDHLVETEGSIDGQFELQQWQNQVQTLEIGLQELNDHVKDLQSTGKTKNNHDHSLSNLEWELCIDKDGCVRLGTIIKSLDELLLYTQASMRYLSPFNGIFDTEHIRFESSGANIVLSFMGLLLRDAIERPRRHHSPYHIIYEEQKMAMTAKKTNKMILGNNRDNDDRIFAEHMDYLISLYLKYVNPISGLLHKPTFQAYYQSFNDPLMCPIALAICVETAVSLRCYVKYSPEDTRRISDYFYHKCKTILTDIFDDPTRQLETVMTITFLLSYLINIKIDCIEARFYLTVSLLLCNQFEEQFKPYDGDGDDNDEGNKDEESCTCRSCRQQQQQYHDLKEIKMTPAVGRVMFQRHRLESVMNHRLIELFLNGQLDFAAITSMEIQVLDDEPQSVVDHYALNNAILELFRIPYMNIMMKQINRVMHGEASDLRLDFILQFETTIRKWWANLPAKFRVCDDPYSANPYDVLEHVEDILQIAPYTVIHLWTAIVHSSILKPQVTASHDLIKILQENAASTTWKSCKAAIYGMTKSCQLYGNHIMSTPSLNGLVHFDFLRLLYAISNIVTYPDFDIPTEEVQDVIKKCSFILEGSIPVDHRVPLGYSKLEVFMAAVSPSAPPRTNEEGTKPWTPLNVYDEYPLPGLALVSDICLTSFHQLEKSILANT